MIEIIPKVFQDGGIVLGFFTVFSIFFFIILNHFLKQSKESFGIIMAQNAAFNTMNENWQKVVDEHTAMSKEYHLRAQEADKYQREEHLRILDFMTKVKDGSKEDMDKLLITFKEEHRRRSEENKDIVVELGRICATMDKCEKR